VKSAESGLEEQKLFGKVLAGGTGMRMVALEHGKRFILHVKKRGSSGRVSPSFI